MKQSGHTCTHLYRLHVHTVVSYLLNLVMEINSYIGSCLEKFLVNHYIIVVQGSLEILINLLLYKQKYRRTSYLAGLLRRRCWQNFKLANFSNVWRKPMLVIQMDR